MIALKEQAHGGANREAEYPFALPFKKSVGIWGCSPAVVDLTDEGSVRYILPFLLSLTIMETGGALH